MYKIYKFYIVRILQYFVSTLILSRLSQLSVSVYDVIKTL